jgi:hypothetical protein
MQRPWPRIAILPWLALLVFALYNAGTANREDSLCTYWFNMVTHMTACIQFLAVCVFLYYDLWPIPLTPCSSKLLILTIFVMNGMVMGVYVTIFAVLKMHPAVYEALVKTGDDSSKSVNFLLGNHAIHVVPVMFFVLYLLLNIDYVRETYRTSEFGRLAREWSLVLGLALLQAGAMVLLFLGLFAANMGDSDVKYKVWLCYAKEEVWECYTITAAIAIFFASGVVGNWFLTVGAIDAPAPAPEPEPAKGLASGNNSTKTKYRVALRTRPIILNI